MNIDQLTYITEIARTKSLSAAAHHLKVTVPAISQSLANLEAELDIKLFTRSRQGAVLTPEGQLLLPKANEILSHIKEFKDMAASSTSALSGELRIGTIPGPMTMLVRAIASYKRDHPNVKFVISEMSAAEIVTSIQRHDIDLGFMIAERDQAPKQSQLRFEKVAESKWYCCGSASGPLALQRTVTAEDLVKYSFVLYKDAFYPSILSRLAKKQINLDVLFTSNNINALYLAMEEGLAVTLVLDYSLIEARLKERGIVAVEIDDPVNYPVELGWVHLQNKSDSILIRSFMDRIKPAYDSSV